MHCGRSRAADSGGLGERKQGAGLRVARHCTADLEEARVGQVAEPRQGMCLAVGGAGAEFLGVHSS